MLCIACDISCLHLDGRDLRKERDMAKRASLTDPLTGISNRSHMIKQLKTQLVLVREQGTSCGIAIVDLDFFKAINDRFGHPGGDLVLQHFAQTVRHTLRREDSFGRIGGEEFMILLPGICEHSLSERLQHIIDILPPERPLATEPDFFTPAQLAEHCYSLQTVPMAPSSEQMQPFTKPKKKAETGSSLPAHNKTLPAPTLQ